MTSIYGAGKVCPFENQNCNLDTEGLYLEPGDILFAIKYLKSFPRNVTMNNNIFFWYRH